MNDLDKPSLIELERLPTISGGEHGDVKTRQPLRRVYLNKETNMITIEKYDMKKKAWEVTDQYQGVENKKDDSK